jgi:hypothetical protein
MIGYPTDCLICSIGSVKGTIKKTPARLTIEQAPTETRFRFAAELHGQRAPAEASAPPS